MKANVGSIDRLTRVVLGLALLGLLFTADGAFRWVGFIGVIPLLSGITSYCPLYAMLGVSSCPPPARR